MKTTTGPYTKMISSLYPCFVCLNKEINQPLTAVDIYWGMDYLAQTDYYCDRCFLGLRLEGKL